MDKGIGPERELRLYTRAVSAYLAFLVFFSSFSLSFLHVFIFCLLQENMPGVSFFAILFCIPTHLVSFFINWFVYASFLCVFREFSCFSLFFVSCNLPFPCASQNKRRRNVGASLSEAWELINPRALFSFSSVKGLGQEGVCMLPNVFMFLYLCVYSNLSFVAVAVTPSSYFSCLSSCPSYSSHPLKCTESTFFVFSSVLPILLPLSFPLQDSYFTSLSFSS